MKRILVLSFENLSEDKDVHYLSKAIPIEISYLLSHYPYLRVVATQKHTSTDAAITAQKTTVDYILKGTFLKINTHIRFHIQLIAAISHECLLTAKFDESYTDIFEVIDRIATKVVNYFELELKPERQKIKVAPEAYDHYLKGLYHWNSWNLKDIQKAVLHLQQAVTIEHTFAIGYAYLAHCYATLAIILPDEDETHYTQAKSIALQALRLDDRLVEAHLALVLIKLLNDIDVLGAYYSLEKAFSLDSYASDVHYYYTFYLLVIGKYKEALKAVAYAVAEDPLNVQKNSTYGFALMLDGQYTAAEQQLQKVLSLHPTSKPTYDALIWTYILSGQLQKAHALLDQDTVEVFLAPAVQVVVYQQLAEPALLQQWTAFFEQWMQQESHIEKDREASVVYWHMGAPKKALQHLEAFYQQKKGFVRVLTHPAWKSLRESDAFYRYKKRLQLLHPPTLPAHLTETNQEMMVIHSLTSEKVTLPSKNLLYIEAQGSYAKVVYVDEVATVQHQLLRTSLSKIIDDALHTHLYRCHHSFIVNTQLPYTTTGNRKQLQLCIEQYALTIPVSRSKAATIHQHLTIVAK